MSVSPSSIHPPTHTSISLCQHCVTELRLGEEAPVKIGSLSWPGQPPLFPSSIRQAATWTTADLYNLIGQPGRMDTHRSGSDKADKKPEHILLILILVLVGVEAVRKPV